MIMTLPWSNRCWYWRGDQKRRHTLLDSTSTRTTTSWSALRVSQPPRPAAHHVCHDGRVIKDHHQLHSGSPSDLVCRCCRATRGSADCLRSAKLSENCSCTDRNRGWAKLILEKKPSENYRTWYYKSSSSYGGAKQDASHPIQNDKKPPFAVLPVSGAFSFFAASNRDSSSSALPFVLLHRLCQERLLPPVNGAE